MEVVMLVPSSLQPTNFLSALFATLQHHIPVTPHPLAKVMAAVRALVDEATRERERQLAPLRAFSERLVAEHHAAVAVHGVVLDALLRRGWCHSYHFTDSHILHLGELVGNGREADIDLFMAEFTRREMSRILKTAREKCPDRAVILTDAFDAHDAKTYTLSIPAILAQVDGIGCESIGLSRHFFSAKKREQGLAATLARFRWPWDGSAYSLGSIHERMLSALTQAWGLALDTDERDDDGSPLNRHGVLHGLDTDYATELNSLRCILILGFVLEVRQIIHEELPSRLRQLALVSD